MDTDQLTRIRETIYRAFAHDEDAAVVERALASLSQLAVVTAERDALRAQIAAIYEALERVDGVMTPFGDGDVVQTYVMPTGPWHAVLGLVRGVDGGQVVLQERDALLQQAERYHAALSAIAEWTHAAGCEMTMYGNAYECSCISPGPWAIARDALVQEETP